MKTPTPNFNNRVVKIAGEVPLLLFKVYYDASNFLRLSTKYVLVSEATEVQYKPYIEELISLRYGGNEDDHLFAPNELEISLIRNSETANFLDRYVKGQKVEAYFWFESLYFQTDLLPMGIFKINEVRDIGLGSFRLHCLSDESKFFEEQPIDLLNDTDYPSMLPGNKSEPWPMVLGDFTNPATSQYRYMDAYRPKLTICYCIDEGEFKFLNYRHGEKDPQSVTTRAFQYEAVGGGLFSTIEDDVETRAWQQSITANHERIIDIDPYTAVDRGYARAIRILPAKPATDNVCPDWKDACDLNRNSVATLSAFLDTLSLEFNELEEIGSILPASETNRFVFRFGLNLDAVVGSVTVRLFYDGTQRISQVFNTTGYKISSGWWGSPDPLDMTKLKIQASIGVGSGADIDGFHVWILYWSEQNVPPMIWAPKKAPRRRGRTIAANRSMKEIPDKTEPEYKLSEIFAEAQGPANYSGIGPMDYTHILASLYFILGRMVGYPDTEIDRIGSWYSVYLDMGDNWKFGINLHTKENPKLLLESGLEEAQLKMWRNCDNMFAIFRSNKAAASPDMVFSEQKENVYNLIDFRWGYTDVFYNKFDLKYRWGPGKNEFQEVYQKDKDNDSDLLASFNSYGIESPWPSPEFEWVQDEATMDLIFGVLKTIYSASRIWVEFKTTHIGCLLELGDTIRTNHSSQTWSESAIDFQVVQIEQEDINFLIRAIEVRT